MIGINCLGLLDKLIVVVWVRLFIGICWFKEWVFWLGSLFYRLNFLFGKSRSCNSYYSGRVFS